MRCRAWVKVEHRRRKGSGKPYELAHAVGDAYARWPVGVPRDDPIVDQPVAPEGTERCGGVIVAMIEAGEEAHWGGTSAVLDIRYTCQRCDWRYHGIALPTTDEELSDAELPDD